MRSLRLLALLPFLALAAGCSDSNPQGGWWPDAFDTGFVFPTTDSGGDAGAPKDLPVTPDPGSPFDPGGGPQDPGGSPDPGIVSCTVGQPCDDLDPCTTNDLCIAGVCQGSTISCEDDGIPCTIDECVAGACDHPVMDGFCYIDGICWADAQTNPANACQACNALTSPKDWTTTTSGPCDDQDPCTENDVCVGGICTGTMIFCPPSGQLCYENACVAGSCQLQPTSGSSCEDGDSCTIGDACVDGTCTPGPLKDEDGDGSVDQACGGDDCDDSSLVVKPGLAEVCEDGHDNDCNGQTDGADPACSSVGETCSYHSECYPEKVCAYWGATGEQRCSVPCAGNADCEAGYVCSKLPGSSQVGFCQPAVAGLLPDGSACSDDSECASTVCVGTCTPTCLSEAYCPGAGQTCSMVGDLTAGFITGTCMTNPPGTFDNGQVCLSGVQYTGSVCASGHCDFMTGFEPYYCANLCKSQLDCTATQDCSIVLYSTVSNPLAVVYDPQLEGMGNPAYLTPHDSVTACTTRASGTPGTKAYGTPCSSDNECIGGKCLPLLPGQSTTYCTGYCTHDSDCQGGMACKLEMSTIVSPFLNVFGAPDFPPQPGWWTYTRLCKFP